MSTDVLLDRYQIDSVLTHRPGKRSLKAEDRQTGQFVLIREYDLRDRLNLERLERFKRQAELLRQMSHPRVPALLDWVQTDEQLLLISQFLPGQTLAARLATGWKPQQKEALAIAEQLLQSLSYLQSHPQSSLSFALRPEKLLIDALGRVWLADFGGLQPRNALAELAASLIHLLTGREPGQLPRLKDKPAFHAFVAISNEFSRWLEDLLEAGPKQRADQALESLWKLQGKPWQPPLTEIRAAGRQARPHEGPWPLQTMLAGSYRLSQVLGRGQGSWKYAAWDMALKQDVTLRLLPLPGHLSDADSLEAYLEAARARQSLHHPQIPRFLRAFVTEQAGQPYLGLAHVLVGGETLKDKFEAGWRPTAAELWDLSRQLLKVLAAVQDREQGHGNLNPSNLVVNKFGRVWLIDFGLLPAEPARDLYDLAASLIYLLSGAQPGEFLAGGLRLRFADGKPLPPPLEAWLRTMLQVQPGQAPLTASQALEAFDRALLAAQPAKLVEPPPLIQVVSARQARTAVKSAAKAAAQSKAKAAARGGEKGAALPWEAGVDQLSALGLQSRLLEGGGLELHCPESKELSQWNRSKTIGMLANPLRMFEEIQQQSRQKSKFFPLSGHRLEISPEDIRLCKAGSASGEQQILAIYWEQLLQARLTPAPPKLLEALKNKVMPPAGTKFRLFHLMLTNQAQNAHCLMFLPPKAIPPLTRLIHQQLAGGF